MTFLMFSTTEPSSWVAYVCFIAFLVLLNSHANRSIPSTLHANVTPDRRATLISSQCAFSSQFNTYPC
ncbi:hypothetical protein FA15DRAFT_468235 [Coprinopsis marcescibilis]|uniref:Uncharacterized protein n=1 Tax=Coprinopsis marcescibilis TaxID=230819 RepID=A0A5C3KS87_COPMA|nr:hypothetical protein FA15DRAFT_468235 [Coprinopsis marcescibilis]